MEVILGPAACSECKTPLVWARPKRYRRTDTNMLRWRDPKTGQVHHCGTIG